MPFNTLFSEVVFIQQSFVQHFTLLLLAIFQVTGLSGQSDTLEFVRYPDKSCSFIEVKGNDTAKVFLYPNGQMASKVAMHRWSANGQYSGWYPDGKLRCSFQVVDDTPTGKANFYTPDGKHAATLHFTPNKTDSLLWIKPGLHLLNGTATFKSTVYGGVDWGDGRSNVSENAGPLQNFKLKLVRVGENQIPQEMAETTTDVWGRFFFFPPEGLFSVFPALPSPETLPKGTLKPIDMPSSSGFSSWDAPEPLSVKATSKLLRFNLFYNSTGYAP